MRISDSQHNPSRSTGKRTVSIGKRGTLVLPAELRKRMGLDEGSIAVIEEREQGVLIRPAVAIPLEGYSSERKAEFLLSNTTDKEDLLRVREVVKGMGLEPDEIPHVRPE